MDAAKFVILGGGMVAGYAAKQLADLGLKPGELAILSADNSVPYERPPLSKGFLAGKETEEAIRINAEDFYRNHGIELKLGCEVSSVDCNHKRLTLKSGEVFGFERLIIATGARPRTLVIPGPTLRQVFYLRSVEDSKSIRRAAERAKRAVVIGGGFIGTEVAAVLAQKNIEVTMVLNEGRIWKRLFTPEMSEFFENYYSSRGVEIIKNAIVADLRGNSSIQSVVLTDGHVIACDLVVAGIGVKPATEMLTNCGIEIGDGVMVNEYLEASFPDVYAAGDVANYWDVLFARRRRVEHWDNAVSQGQYLARALTGERLSFRHVPYFFSDVFDLSYEYWGDTSGSDLVVSRGDFSGKSFSVWWLRENRVVAAFTMNRPDEERDVAPKWIESRQVVDSRRLQDNAKLVLEAAA